MNKDASTFFEVAKSWTEGPDTIIEGWVAPYTNGFDLDKHRYPPRAFESALPEYFQRNAPISDAHDMAPHPKGHHQRSVLIEDGKPFLEVEHPTDSAPFTRLPASGSGWWSRARINNPTTSNQIQKGNMAGFSWTGVITEHHPVPGGLEFDKVGTIRETCVAAYPRNTSAIFQVSKADTQAGNTPTADITLVSREELERQNTELERTELEELMLGAFKKLEAERATTAKAEEITAMKAENVALKEQLATIQTDFDAKIAALTDEVKKAAIPPRGDGTGTKQIVKTYEEQRDEDPLGMIVQKAGKNEKFDPTDKEVVARLFVGMLSENMKYTANGE